MGPPAVAATTIWLCALSLGAGLVRGVHHTPAKSKEAEDFRKEALDTFDMWLCKKSEDPNMAPMNEKYALERHVSVRQCLACSCSACP